MNTNAKSGDRATLGKTKPPESPNELFELDVLQRLDIFIGGPDEYEQHVSTVSTLEDLFIAMDGLFDIGVTDIRVSRYSVVAP